MKAKSVTLEINERHIADEEYIRRLMLVCTFQRKEEKKRE